MAEQNRTELEMPPVAAVPGRFDAYGGRYVPETLMAALQELEAAYADAKRDPAFASELSYLLHHYAGRRAGREVGMRSFRGSWARCPSNIQPQVTQRRKEDA